MAELDNLTIKIQGDTSDASSAISGLIDSLKKLQGSLNGISTARFNEALTASANSIGALQAAANKVNTNGIDKIRQWLTGLSGAAKEFDGSKFKTIADSIESLTSIGSGNLPNFKDVGAGLGLLGEGAGESADAIQKVGNGLKSLSEVTIPDGLADEIANFADSITKISGAKTPNFDGVEHFSEICKTLKDSLPSFEVGKTTQAWGALLRDLSNLKFSQIGPEIKAAEAALNSFKDVQVPDFSNLKTLAGAMTVLQNSLSALPKTVSDAIAASGNLKRITVPKDFAENMTRVANAVKSFTIAPDALGSAVQLGDGLAAAGAKIQSAADAFDKVVPSIEKLSQVVIPPEIATQLMEIATALEQLISISPEKIGAIKNQMQGLGSTGKAVQNAANSAKNAAKGFGGKGKNGFVDSFMGGADSMGLLTDASITLGARLGAISSVAQFSTDMFKKLTGSVFSLSSMFSKTSRSSNVFHSSLQKIYYTLGTIRRVAYAVRAAFNAIKVPIDLASDLTEVQNVVLQAFGPQNFENIDNWSKSLVTSFGISSKTAKEAAARYGAMAVSMGVSQKQATEMAKTMVERAADIGSLYNKDFETVAKNMDSVFTGMVAPMRKYGVDLTQASLKEYAMSKGMDSNIKGMSQMQKALLRYQYVLEKTTIAQGDFARTSDTWANQVKILKTYLEALGSTIGQVFINLFKPIIKTVNNAMNAIIGLVERTVNAIGKMMGWQVEIAPTFADVGEMEEEIADTAEDAAGGLDSANDSAKKLKRTILGFDEIHALQRPDSGSSKDKSGKGSGDDAGAADAAENIVKGGEMLLKRYESDIKDWFDLGNRIGETLAEALESIDWNKVYQGASGFGTNLASFLNGLITPRLFGDVGKTVAGALNTALHFLDSFGTTFNWRNFGNSLAAGLNGFFSTFDFKLLAHTVNTWANGLLTTIIQFLGKVDWKQIVRGLNEFIGGLNFTGQFGKLGTSISHALVDVMKTIDWNMIYSQAKNFASGLADFLNSLITPNLFMKIGGTLAGVLNTVFGFLNTFWQDFDWHGFGVSLADGISRFFADFDAEQFSSYIGNFIRSFFTVIGTVLTHTDIGAIVEALKIVIGSITTTEALRISAQHVGQIIGEKFKAGVLWVINPSNWVDVYNKLNLLGQRLISALAGGLNTGDLLESFNTVFGAVEVHTASTIGTIGGLATAAGGFFSMWTNGWSIVGEIIKDIGIAVAGAAAVMAGFVTGPIAIAVGAIAAGASTIAVVIHDKIKGDAKNDFLDFIASTEGAGHTLDDFAQATKDAMDSVTKDIDGLDQNFKHLSSVREEIGQTITKITGIATAMSETGTATESEVNDLMTSFTNLQSSLQDYIDSYYDAIIEQMVIDMQYLESQGKLTDEMKSEYAKRITETYKARDAAKESADEVIANFETASQNVSDMAEQYGWDSQETQDATKDFMDVVVKAQGVVQKYTGEFNDGLSPAIDDAKDELDKLAGGLDLSKESMDDAKEFTHRYTDTVRDMQSQVDDAKETVHNYYQNLRDNLSETTTSQAEYDALMEEYNTMEQTRIQDIEDKYDELKTQLDNEVRPAFDNMHVSMSDNLDQMDRDADSKLSRLFSTFGGWIQNIKDKWNELRGLHIDADADLTTSETSIPALPVRKYATGGIIEDGLFTMSNGEIAGRFTNGQSVVANNEQIQNGIRDAVVDGMMEVYMATYSDRDDKSGDLVLFIGEEEVARASMRGQRKLDKRFNPVIDMG